MLRPPFEGKCGTEEKTGHCSYAGRRVAAQAGGSFGHDPHTAIDGSHLHRRALRDGQARGGGAEQKRIAGGPQLYEVYG